MWIHLNKADHRLFQQKVEGINYDLPLTLLFLLGRKLWVACGIRDRLSSGDPGRTYSL